MPGAQCTRSLVCEVVVEDAHEYSQRSHRKSPGIPARNGFTAYFVLSPAIGLSCHRRLADIGTSARSGSRTSARLDAGVEASGPHDFAVRCSTVRLRASGIAHGNPPCDHTLRAGTAASTASRPASMTMANAPLWDGTANHIA